MVMSPSKSRGPLFAVGLYLGFMVLHIALAWDGGHIVTGLLPDSGQWLGPINWGIYAAFTLALVAVLHGWSRVGLTRMPARGWFRLAAVPIAAGLPFLLLGINLEASAILPLLVVGTPLIALNEELFFRGIMLDLLRPLGWRSAILGSAVLFGLSHVVNLVAGANVPFTAMQVAATTAGGVALAAIRIRTGSLGPVLVAHLLIDVIAISTLTGSATTSPLLLPVLFVWLAANLALWRYGWGLLAVSSHAVYDASARGPRLVNDRSGLV
jgi:membrane protease YdiL (CAAX protease family)